MITSTLLFVVYFTFIAVPGFVLSRRFSPAEKHWLVLLPLSVVAGMSVYLFGLNLWLYLFPLATANKAWAFMFFAGGVLLGKKSGAFRIDELSVDLSRDERRVFLCFLAVFTCLFALLIWGTFYADNIYHTTLAISLQNGNAHPLLWPWYPGKYWAYHYGYDLLKAATQDFCGINQQYSDKPWYVVLVAAVFCFVTGFVKRSFGGNYRVGLAAAVCVLLFCGFASVNMIEAAVRIALDALHQPVKETYDALIGYYKGAQGQDISFFAASLHKPMLMRFPVFLSLVYFFIQGPKKKAFDWAYVVFHVALLALLGLCDESLFGLTGLGLGLFTLSKLLLLPRGEKLTFFSHAMTVLILGGITAVVQGGVLTTLFFHGSEQYLPGSENAMAGGLARLSLRDNFTFALNPVFTLNWKTLGVQLWHFLVPMFCFVALQVSTYRNRTRFSPEWRDTFLVWCLTFWIGFFIAGLFMVAQNDLVTGRMYLWPMLTLSTGVCLALWIGSFFDRRGKQKLGAWITCLVLALFLTGTLFRIGAGCAMSVAFQVSNEKKQMRKDLEYGNWLRHLMPRDTVTFGIDARYTGLFSFGGNPFLDDLAIPKSELEPYQKAKAVVDRGFLVRNKVTCLVLDRTRFEANREVLTNHNHFVEVAGPYTNDYRAFLVLP